MTSMVPGPSAEETSEGTGAATTPVTSAAPPAPSAPSEASKPSESKREGPERVGAPGSAEGSAQASAARSPKTGALVRTASRSRGRRRKRRSPAKDKLGRRRREREREREQRKGREGGSEGPARAADTQILVTAPICRESRACYMFGNYDQYYKQRFDRFATVDKRLQGVLLKVGNIFADKAVLDIGCNTGFITFLVAAMGARQVEGVDIDVTCISRALRYLRWLKQRGFKTLPEGPKEEAAGEGEGKDPKESKAFWYKKQYPVSCVQSRGHIPYHAKPLAAGALQAALSKAKVLEKAVPVSAPPARPGFPYNIEFRSENVLYTQVEGQRKVQYDVVLLFRLTKWIHINWGDDGIERLFTRCNEWLRLGGLLVLEVSGQPYAKEKHVNAQTCAIRDNLILTPGNFDWYLTNTYGFEKLSDYIFERGMRAHLQIYRKVAKVEAVDIQPRPEVPEMRPPAPPTVIRPRKLGQVVPARQPGEAEMPAAGPPGPTPGEASQAPKEAHTSQEAAQDVASTGSPSQAKVEEQADSTERPAKRLRTESSESQ